MEVVPRYKLLTLLIAVTAVIDVSAGTHLIL